MTVLEGHTGLQVFKGKTMKQLSVELWFTVKQLLAELWFLRPG